MLESLGHLNCKILAASYFNFLFSIPILVMRKLKNHFSKKGHAQSDFFLNLPWVLNQVFAVLFKLEISLLRFLRYPFGISILVVLERSHDYATEAKK